MIRTTFLIKLLDNYLKLTPKKCERGPGLITIEWISMRQKKLNPIQQRWHNNVLLRLAHKLACKNMYIELTLHCSCFVNMKFN